MSDTKRIEIEVTVRVRDTKTMNPVGKSETRYAIFGGSASPGQRTTLAYVATVSAIEAGKSLFGAPLSMGGGKADKVR